MGSKVCPPTEIQGIERKRRAKSTGTFLRRGGTKGEQQGGCKKMNIAKSRDRREEKKSCCAVGLGKSE